MTSYLVTYQIRRRGIIAIPQGDWQDKEMVVLAGDDARGAVDAIADTVLGHDFRLIGVEANGRVDVIAQSLR